AEHEVVDGELGAAVEQFGQGLGAVLGLQRVLLLDRQPRQPLALRSQLVAQPGQRLLALEQLTPGRSPFFTRHDRVRGHAATGSVWTIAAFWRSSAFATPARQPSASDCDI